MARLALILSAVFIVGCAHHPAADTHRGVGNGVKGAQVWNDQMKTEVDAAITKATGDFLDFCMRLKRMLLQQNVELVASMTANDEMQTAYSKLDTDNVVLKRELKAEHEQLFSDKQHALATYWFIAAVLGVLLCGIGLMGATIGYTICAYSGRVLLCGTGIAPALWVFDHFWLRKVSAA